MEQESEVLQGVLNEPATCRSVEESKVGGNIDEQRATTIQPVPLEGSENKGSGDPGGVHGGHGSMEDLHTQNVPGSLDSGKIVVSDDRVDEEVKDNSLDSIAHTSMVPGEVDPDIPGAIITREEDGQETYHERETPTVSTAAEETTSKEAETLNLSNVSTHPLGSDSLPPNEGAIFSEECKEGSNLLSSEEHGSEISVQEGIKPVEEYTESATQKDGDEAINKQFSEEQATHSTVMDVPMAKQFDSVPCIESAEVTCSTVFGNFDIGGNCSMKDEQQVELPPTVTAASSSQEECSNIYEVRTGHDVPTSEEPLGDISMDTKNVDKSNSESVTTGRLDPSIIMDPVSMGEKQLSEESDNKSPVCVHTEEHISGKVFFSESKLAVPTLSVEGADINLTKEQVKSTITSTVEEGKPREIEHIQHTGLTQTLTIGTGAVVDTSTTVGDKESAESVTSTSTGIEQKSIVSDMTTMEIGTEADERVALMDISEKSDNDSGHMPVGCPMGDRQSSQSTAEVNNSSIQQLPQSTCPVIEEAMDMTEEPMEVTESIDQISSSGKSAEEPKAVTEVAPIGSEESDKHSEELVPHKLSGSGVASLNMEKSQECNLEVENVSTTMEELDGSPEDVAEEPMEVTENFDQISSSEKSAKEPKAVTEVAPIGSKESDKHSEELVPHKLSGSGVTSLNMEKSQECNLEVEKVSTAMEELDDSLEEIEQSDVAMASSGSGEVVASVVLGNCGEKRITEEMPEIEIDIDVQKKEDQPEQYNESQELHASAPALAGNKNIEILITEKQPLEVDEDEDQSSKEEKEQNVYPVQPISEIQEQHSHVGDSLEKGVTISEPSSTEGQTSYFDTTSGTLNTDKPREELSKHLLHENSQPISTVESGSTAKNEQPLQTDLVEASQNQESLSSEIVVADNVGSISTTNEGEMDVHVDEVPKVIVIDLSDNGTAECSQSIEDISDNGRSNAESSEVKDNGEHHVGTSQEPHQSNMDQDKKLSEVTEEQDEVTRSEDNITSVQMQFSIDTSSKSEESTDDGDPEVTVSSSTEVNPVCKEICSDKNTVEEMERVAAPATYIPSESNEDHIISEADKMSEVSEEGGNNKVTDTNKASTCPQELVEESITEECHALPSSQNIPVSINARESTKAIVEEFSLKESPGSSLDDTRIRQEEIKRSGNIADETEGDLSKAVAKDSDTLSTKDIQDTILVGVTQDESNEHQKEEVVTPDDEGQPKVFDLTDHNERGAQAIVEEAEEVPDRKEPQTFNIIRQDDEELNEAMDEEATDASSNDDKSNAGIESVGSIPEETEKEHSHTSSVEEADSGKEIEKTVDTAEAMTTDASKSRISDTAMVVTDDGDALVSSGSEDSSRSNTSEVREDVTVTSSSDIGMNILDTGALFASQSNEAEVMALESEVNQSIVDMPRKMSDVQILCQRSMSKETREVRAETGNNVIGQDEICNTSDNRSIETSDAAAADFTPHSNNNVPDETSEMSIGDLSSHLAMTSAPPDVDPDIGASGIELEKDDDTSDDRVAEEALVDANITSQFTTTVPDKTMKESSEEISSESATGVDPRDVGPDVGGAGQALEESDDAMEIAAADFTSQPNNDVPDETSEVSIGELSSHLATTSAPPDIDPDIGASGIELEKDDDTSDDRVVEEALVDANITSQSTTTVPDKTMKESSEEISSESATGVDPRDVGPDVGGAGQALEESDDAMEIAAADFTSQPNNDVPDETSEVSIGELSSHLATTSAPPDIDPDIGVSGIELEKDDDTSDDRVVEEALVDANITSQSTTTVPDKTMKESSEEISSESATGVDPRDVRPDVRGAGQALEESDEAMEISAADFTSQPNNDVPDETSEVSIGELSSHLATTSAPPDIDPDIGVSGIELEKDDDISDDRVVEEALVDANITSQSTTTVPDKTMKESSEEISSESATGVDPRDVGPDVGGAGQALEESDEAMEIDEEYAKPKTSTEESIAEAPASDSCVLKATERISEEQRHLDSTDEVEAVLGGQLEDSGSSGKPEMVGDAHECKDMSAAVASDEPIKESPMVESLHASVGDSVIVPDGHLDHMDAVTTESVPESSVAEEAGDGSQIRGVLGKEFLPKESSHVNQTDASSNSPISEEEETNNQISTKETLSQDQTNDSKTSPEDDVQLEASQSMNTEIPSGPAEQNQSDKSEESGTASKEREKDMNEDQRNIISKVEENSGGQESERKDSAVPIEESVQKIRKEMEVSEVISEVSENLAEKIHEEVIEILESSPAEQDLSDKSEESGTAPKEREKEMKEDQRNIISKVGENSGEQICERKDGAVPIEESVQKVRKEMEKVSEVISEVSAHLAEKIHEEVIEILEESSKCEEGGEIKESDEKEIQSEASEEIVAPEMTLSKLQKEETDRSTSEDDGTKPKDKASSSNENIPGKASQERKDDSSEDGPVDINQTTEQAGSVSAKGEDGSLSDQDDGSLMIDEEAAGDGDIILVDDSEICKEVKDSSVEEESIPKTTHDDITLKAGNSTAIEMTDVPRQKPFEEKDPQQILGQLAVTAQPADEDTANMILQEILKMSETIGDGVVAIPVTTPEGEILKVPLTVEQTGVSTSCIASVHVDDVGNPKDREAQVVSDKSDISSEAMPDISSEATPDISSEAMPDISSEAMPDISSEATPHISSEAVDVPEVNGGDVQAEDTSDHHLQSQDNFDEAEVLALESEASRTTPITEARKAKKRIFSKTCRTGKCSCKYCLEERRAKRAKQTPAEVTPDENNKAKRKPMPTSKFKKLAITFAPTVEKVKCSSCTLDFENEKDMQAHFESTHVNPPKLCSICRQSFQNEELMKLHELSHQKSGMFLCLTCDRSYKRKADIVRHCNSHKDKVPSPVKRKSSAEVIVVDDQEDSKPAQPVKMRKLSVAFTGAVEKVKCTVCSQEFKGETEMKAHLNSVHSKVPSKDPSKEPSKNPSKVPTKVLMLCSICQESFQSEEAVKKHESSHERGGRFMCLVCNKSYKRRTDIVNHYSTHKAKVKVEQVKVESSSSSSQEKPKASSSPASGPSKVKQTPVKPKSELFSCKLCGKEFVHEELLVEHKKIHTGAFPFPCSMCDKAFKQANQLKKHERVHTGDKPYMCQYCNKRFYSSSNKRRHERTHTGFKPYVCRICDKPLSEKWILKKHEKMHLSIGGISFDD